MVYKTHLHVWVMLFWVLWLLAACTTNPEAEATIPVTRPTTLATPTLEAVANQTSPSPSPVPLPTDVLTATATATPTPSPGPTPISTEDAQATITAGYATSIAENATLFATPPTFTPSPTFTPAPGPVWRIFFQGAPCQDTFRCEDTLFMDRRPAGYLINSDGSQLTPITDLGFPADFSHPVFSVDGAQLAYLANLEPEGLWHLFLANADGLEAVDLGAGDFWDFQFTSEAGCLVTARFVSRAIEGTSLIIEKRCMGQMQPQQLETVTFPVFYEIDFSPHGDSLLAYGRSSLDEVHLLVHLIGGSTQTIFSQTSEYFTGAARWLSDSEKIRFIGTEYLGPNNTITTTFNLIESDGNNLEVQLSVIADFAITYGSWSPDGEEFAFTYGNAAGEESGIYILDLNTGEWQQILSHFYLTSSPGIYIWQQGTNVSE